MKSLRPSPLRVVHAKGNLSATHLRFLAAIAILPLVMIVARAMALAGASTSWFIPGFLRSIGDALNQSLSLTAVPAAQREQVLYLLSIPSLALIVTLARLTFGIRVLGFRSILLAVGFHHSGVLPSLLLITIVVTTIVTVRPWLRRVRLPYYARVSVILCIVAMTMVGVLLASPWMRSDVLWGIAYFPVIVLGMLAEGIAHTLDRDSALTAAWRAVTTILLAFVMAIVVRVPAVRDALLQFPELALAQIVAIVLVAEYLDLRLFQDWDTRAAGVALPRLFAEHAARIAVVRDRHADDLGLAVDTDTGAGARRAKRDRQRLRELADALRQAGHTVRVFDADATLLRELERYVPRHPRSGEPGGLVLNLARGDAGDAGAAHVPALLEFAGFAAIGPSARSHALMLDRAATRSLLLQAEIPAPAFRLVTAPEDECGDLDYPLAVRPRHASRVPPRIVSDRRELEAAVRALLRRGMQQVFVEEHVAGRDFHVALLGNSPVESLPLVELLRDGDRGRSRARCARAIDAHLAAEIRAQAKATFWACDGRDYARVRVRVSNVGQVCVIDIGTLGVLAAGGSFARAAKAAGLDYSMLLARIVDIARERLRSDAPMRPPEAGSMGTAVTGTAPRSKVISSR